MALNGRALSDHGAKINKPFQAGGNIKTKIIPNMRPQRTAPSLSRALVGIFAHHKVAKPGLDNKLLLEFSLLIGMQTSACIL